jgi:hypothetical protein
MEDEEKSATSTQVETKGAATAANHGSARSPASSVEVVLHSAAIVSLATKKPRRVTKRGWGPFQSVVKERSADFNLTLDVNNLRQEVQHLTSVRDMQRSKVLIQRHSPEGSLAKMVHEYFRVFHRGSPPSSSSWAERRHSTGSSLDSAIGARIGASRASESTSSSSNTSPTELRQRQLLHRMMDEQVDFGCDARGPDALADLIKHLSGLLRVLGLTLEALDVTAVDEAVIVATRARLRFRVIRETIEEQFPHISTHRRLVSSLLDREIEAGGRLLFYFGEHDKCVQLLNDVDFVSAFGAVLADPSDLAILLDAGFVETAGQGGIDARENWHHSPRRPLVQAHGPQDDIRAGHIIYHHHDGTPAFPEEHRRQFYNAHHIVSQDSREFQRSEHQSESEDISYAPRTPQLPRLTRSLSSHHLHAAASEIDAVELDAVEEYFPCFENAFATLDRQIPHPHDRIDVVRAFMGRAFTPDMRYGHHLAGWSALERRWTALSDTFELRAFRREGSPRSSTSQIGMSSLHVVAVRAIYSLHVTMRTLARVFPRLLEPRNAAIQHHLLGQTLAVHAQLTFSLDPALRIARVDERVDFVGAMRVLLGPLAAVDPDALLADANLAGSGLEDEIETHGHAMMAMGRSRSRSEPGAGSEARQRQALMSFSDLLSGWETR